MNNHRERKEHKEVLILSLFVISAFFAVKPL